MNNETKTHGAQGSKDRGYAKTAGSGNARPDESGKLFKKRFHSVLLLCRQLMLQHILVILSGHIAPADHTDAVAACSDH